MGLALWTYATTSSTEAVGSWTHFGTMFLILRVRVENGLHRKQRPWVSEGEETIGTVLSVTLVVPVERRGTQKKAVDSSERVRSVELHHVCVLRASL